MTNTGPDFRKLLLCLVDALNVCEGNRGAFSCHERHDCRCPKGRAPSDVDDHIVPIALGGSKSDLDNQQGLCTPCHGFKTATEQRDPFFGLRLRQAGAAIGEPAPLGWRDLKPFGGTR